MLMHKFAWTGNPSDVAVKLSVFYGAIFLIVGTYAAFLPLWLAAQGLTPSQIALIFAMPVMMRPVFTTLLSFFADRSGRHVQLLRMLAAGALASLSVLPFGGGFPVILTAFTFFALFWTTVLPLTDAVALAAARRGAADYGRTRLWGSLSYIAVTLGGGLAVDLYGSAAALWLFIAAAACVVLAAQLLPAMERSNDGGPALRPIRFADLGALMRLPVLWLFLAASSTVQATHAVYYLFGTIHWIGIGISPVVVGALWCIGVIAEVALFAFSARIMRRIGPVELLLIGAVAAIVRWALTSFDPPLAALFALQVLHALTFGATFLGAMAFINRAFAPNAAATAQGLYASFAAGIAMGAAYLGAGPLYRSFGAGAYLGMALLGVLAVTLGLMLLRRWDGGLLYPQSEEEGGRMKAPA